MKSHFFQQTCALLRSGECSFHRVLFLFGEQHAPSYLGQTQSRRGSKKKHKRKRNQKASVEDK